MKPIRLYRIVRRDYDDLNYVDWARVAGLGLITVSGAVSILIMVWVYQSVTTWAHTISAALR